MPTTEPVVPQTATWARRAAALVVDWLLCVLVVLVVGGVDAYQRTGNFFIPALFVLESALFTSVAGGSIGKLATRLRSVRADGGPSHLDPLRSLARAVLLVLVIPPLVFRPDGRGLHDVVAGTSTVTLDTFRALRGR